MSIQQLGVGGVLFVGARHTFDYYNDVAGGQDGLDGFDPVRVSEPVNAPPGRAVAQAIAAGLFAPMQGLGVDLDIPERDTNDRPYLTTASILGGTRAWSLDSSFYVGVNLFSGTKTPSLGVSLSSSVSLSDGVGTLADVDGDGLPDRLVCSRSSCSYNRNLGFNEAGVLEFEDAQGLAHMPGIHRERTFSFGVGPSINVGAQFHYNFSVTVAQSPRYLTDANGDGIIDVVDRGDVLFGYHQMSEPDGTTHSLEEAPVAYARSSAFTPVALGGAAFVPLSDEDLEELEAELHAATPPEDALRLWRAPYDGTVRVTGSIALTQLPVAEPSDGVTAFVEVARPNGASGDIESLFVASLGAAQLTAVHDDQVAVAAGDHLVFRLHTRVDGLNDEVTWSPTVEYVGLPAGNDTTGTDRSYYSPQADFIAIGGGTIVGLPLSGVIEVTGQISKTATTTDDVWVELVKNGEVVDRHFIPRGATGPISVTLHDTVVVDAMLTEDSPPASESDPDNEPDPLTADISVRLFTRVPIDLTHVVPSGAFQVIYTEANDGGTPVPVVDNEGRPTPQMILPVDFQAFVPVAPAGMTAVVPVAPVTFAAADVPMGETPPAVTDVTFTALANFVPPEPEEGEDPAAPRTFWLVAVANGDVIHSSAIDVIPVPPMVLGQPIDPAGFMATITWAMPTGVPVSLFVSASRAGDWDGTAFTLSHTVGAGSGGMSSMGAIATPFEAFDIALPQPYSAPYRGWRAGSIRPGSTPEELSWYQLFGQGDCQSGYEGMRRGQARRQARRDRKEQREQGEQAEPPDDYENNEPSLEEPDVEEGLACDDEEFARRTPESRRGPVRGVTQGTGCLEDENPEREELDFDAESLPEDVPSELQCPRLSVPHWRGLDDRVYVSATTMSASRLGPDRIPLARVGDLVAPDPGNDGNGRGITTMGVTRAHSFGGGAGGASFSRGTTKSRNRLDFRDLNGDGIPDIVRPERAAMSTPIGAYEDRTSLCLNAAGTCGEQVRSRSITGAVGYGGTRVGQRGDASGQEGGTESNGRTGNSNNDGSGGSYSFSVGGNASVSANDFDYLDVNGDGLPDRVRVQRNDESFNVSAMMVRINLGYDFAPEVVWGTNDIHRSSSWELNAGLGYTDGDQGWNIGLSGSISRSHVRTLTGAAENRLIPERVRDLFQGHSTLLDINADGLLDVVAPGEGGYQVHLNTGAGFAAEPISWNGGRASSGSTVVEVSEADTFNVSANLGFTFGVGPLVPIAGLIYIPFNLNFGAGASNSRPKVAVQDIDGDGAADHLFSLGSTVEVALNRTRRTGLLRTVNRPMGASIELDYELAAHSREMPDARWVMSQVAVYDGLEDVIDPAVGSNWRRQRFAYSGGRYDRAEREFLGFENVSTFDRVPVTMGMTVSMEDYREARLSFHNQTIFDAGLVRRFATYTLEDGQPHLRQVQETAYQLRNVNGSIGAVLDGNGIVSRTPALLSELRAQSWMQVAMTGDSSTVYEINPDGSASPGVATSTAMQVDRLGNVTEYIDHGGGSTTDDHRATIRYANCGGASGPLDGPYIVDVADRILVESIAGVRLRERTSQVDCGHGVRENVRVALNPSENALTTLVYTADGNLLRVVGPAGQGGPTTLTYEYDAQTRTLVTSVTDSQGYVSRTHYDHRFGLADRETDINGAVLSTAFDGFGRPTALLGPFEQEAGRPTITYAYHPEAAEPYATTANFDPLHPSDPIETVTFADGLGRLVQTQKDAAVHTSDTAGSTEVGRVVSGRVEYDALGRTVRAWHPTFRSGASPTFVRAPDASAGPTITSFDRIDRAATLQQPDGATTTTTYSVGSSAENIAVLVATVVDAERKQRSALRDARGNLVEVHEHEGPTRHVTRYAYDPLNQLIQVTDAADNPTLVNYDLAGRRTVIDSPDAGRSTTEYDAAGNVIRRTTAALRARGQSSITYRYEESQLVSVDHPGSEADVRLTWGGATAPAGQRGRVVETRDAGGILEREYGLLGEVTRETRHLYRHNQTAPRLAQMDDPSFRPQGPRLTTRYRHDTWGRMLEMVYPDGEVLTYAYDAGGLVSSVTGRKLGETYPYVTRLEYDHFGQRRYLQQGNGIVTHYTYDAETRRLDTMDAAEFQRLRYVYDGVGNVRSLVNDITSALSANQRGGRVEQAFTYDDLHRLDTATGTWTEPGGARNSYTLDVDYDAIHNITRKAQTHTVSRQGNGRPVPQRRTSYDWTYEYDGPQPHAPSAVGDQSFSYDESGRMESRQQRGMGAPSRTLLWDSEDRIQAIQDGGAAVEDEAGNVVAGRGRTTEFTYDAVGNRITKSGAQGHTAYVGAHYTLRNETIATKHIFIGASRITSKIVPGQQTALSVDTDDVSHTLGRWWLHRSENGWEHARNTEQNPHYRVPTQMPSPMGLPESNFVYFYHPDHLGSSSFVTDGGGEVYEHVQYFPHGEVWADERSNTERLPHLFTGKELDQETGLYDFGARMYDPRLAMWLSPDPALHDYLREIDTRTVALGSSLLPEHAFGVDRNGAIDRERSLPEQSFLAVYSYGLNNPLRVVDPDGRRGVPVDPRRLGLNRPYSQSAGIRFDNHGVPEDGNPVVVVLPGQVLVIEVRIVGRPLDRGDRAFARAYPRNSRRGGQILETRRLRNGTTRLTIRLDQPGEYELNVGIDRPDPMDARRRADGASVTVRAATAAERRQRPQGGGRGPRNPQTPAPPRKPSESQ